MKFSIAVAVAIASLAVIGLVVLTRTGFGLGMDTGSHGGMGMMSGSSVRHSYVMHNGIDAKYAGLSNPLPRSAENIAQGRQIYDQYCAACHGAQGLGDGPAAKGLRPPPASLAGLSRMPMIGDGYLYWTVAEGGIPVGSAMPPFKDVLKPNDTWKVILFAQTM